MVVQKAARALSEEGSQGWPSLVQVSLKSHDKVSLCTSSLLMIVASTYIINLVGFALLTICSLSQLLIDSSITETAHSSIEPLR